jgi:hypothetical protein
VTFLRRPLARRQLFEFEDLTWVPARVRDLITTVLREEIVLGRGVYDCVAPLIAEAIREQRSTRVLDLCSGAGGPWSTLKPRLAEQGVRFDLVLTDKYPNRRAAISRDSDDGSVRYEAVPVDATDVPGHLRGVRTLFTSFHHFRPEVARRILADARRSQQAICVFEFTERKRLPILLTLPLAPLFVVVSAIRARPSDRLRVLLSTVLPVLPVAVTWDGIASNLRTYTAEDLEQMVASLRSEHYEWTVGTLQPEERGKPQVTYVLGRPLHTTINGEA